MKTHLLAISMALALALGARGAQADPASIMGSGNFDLQNSSGFATQFQVLQANGVGVCRINAYPGDYWNGAPVTPASMDSAILQAKSYGITPIILINYYAEYLNNNVPIGPASKWQAVGQAYATRYSPNSAWLKSQGINNWGVTIYEAFNEPDLNSHTYQPTPGTYWMLPANSSDPHASNFSGNYHDALQGFAQGVHGVSSSLKVINGGYCTPCSGRSYNASGYASAVADLFNNGSLNGLNLHTYNDAYYAPLLTTAASSGGWDTEWASFRQFLQVQSTSGITSNPDFYTDEFNYGNPDTPGGAADDNRTAKNLFTMIWQAIGATKSDHSTSACKLALLWSLLPCEGNYTTYNSLSPYSPKPAAQTYKFVAQQTAGCSFASLDPWNTGEWTMTGPNNKKIWVWTNSLNYSNHYNAGWTLNGIPAGTTQLLVYGWDGYNGPRQTINLTAGQTSATISGLATNETYMVVTAPQNFLFYTGFESGQPQPTWNDTPDSKQNVAGYNPNLQPECSTRTGEQAQAGTTALMYSGSATAASALCYYRVFSVNIPITLNTRLQYYIYPQQDNGRYVGVDLHCTDGSTLRDSGAVDSNGYSFHPKAGHGGNIPLNAWTKIEGNIGSKLAGKTVDKIWVAFDRPSPVIGQYRGYIDEIKIANSTTALSASAIKPAAVQASSAPSS